VRHGSAVSMTCASLPDPRRTSACADQGAGPFDSVQLHPASAPRPVGIVIRRPQGVNVRQQGVKRRLVTEFSLIPGGRDRARGRIGEDNRAGPVEFADLTDRLLPPPRAAPSSCASRSVAGRVLVRRFSSQMAMPQTLPAAAGHKAYGQGTLRCCPPIFLPAGGSPTSALRAQRDGLVALIK
jgi:hypothetical protein